MLTLEEFENIMNHIKKNGEDNEKLTDILVSKDCTGFTSFGNELVYDLVFLLSKIFNDEYDNIGWWLWEDSKNVWWNGRKYDLTEVKDLYYWLKKEYDKVKNEVEE